LAVQLLDRGSRGVTLSDSGKVLFERAKFILSQFEEAGSEVRAHNQELTGTVRLMAPSSIGQVLFEPLVDRFLGQFPKVRLELSEGLWNDAASRLRTGAVDLAIMGSATSDYIELEPLAREQMVLVGRVGDPLVAKPSVAVGDLAGLPLLMPELTLETIRRFAPDVVPEARGPHIRRKRTGDPGPGRLRPRLRRRAELRPCWASSRAGRLQACPSAA
jgi:DNA-binding transcriptional LysR family regulator